MKTQIWSISGQLEAVADAIEAGVEVRRNVGAGTAISFNTNAPVEGGEMTQG